MANDPQTTPLIDTSIFIPWCAGGSRDERLARKYCYAASIMPRNPINLAGSSFRPPFRHSGEGRNPGVGMGKCGAVEDYARRGACPPPIADRRSAGGPMLIPLRGLAKAAE